MAKIIIFDSGVGGFSILRELINSGHELLYFADQAFFPYGNKSGEWLAQRLAKVGNWLEIQNPSLVVMACNTATVSGIEIFRKILDCPIVGVEPVIKPAVKFSRTLLIGTQNTLNSTRLKELLSQHGGNVLTFTPRDLPQAIEDTNLIQVKKIIHDIKKVIIRENISALGLSCTHYPLVKEVIRALIPDVTIIDPSKAVASQIRKLCLLNHSLEIKHSKLDINFLTTGDVLRFKYQIKHYLDLDAVPQRIYI